MHQGASHHHGSGHLIFQEGQGGVAEEVGGQDAVDHQDVGHADHDADLRAVAKTVGSEGGHPPGAQPATGSPRVP